MTTIKCGESILLTNPMPRFFFLFTVYSKIFFGDCLRHKFPCGIQGTCCLRSRRSQGKMFYDEFENLFVQKAAKVVFSDQCCIPGFDKVGQ